MATPVWSSMSPQDEIPCLRIEAILARDPAARGVAGLAYGGLHLPSEPFRAALQSLRTANAAAIITGFAIPREGGKFAAETDGPPGALFLARAMLECGVEPCLISDEIGLPALEAGCDFFGLSRSLLREFPFENGGPDAPARQSNQPEFNTATDTWCRWFLQSPFGRAMSHLVALERVGPGHTSQSAAAQTSNEVEAFERLVPQRERNLCRNMRGESINAQTAKTHRLVELLREDHRSVVTIGGGDGGNEIGMGRLPWSLLDKKVARGNGAQIACRIATDHLLTAGVSNWIGYALAMGLCVARGRKSLLRAWGAQELRELLAYLVEQGGCVDGVTRQSQPTVDGLPQDEEAAAFERLQSAFWR